ncbi:MAG TPA: hypothetical protein VG917_03635 [Patescibacteria group bacterium]|nr:hypothetical protein [Patescibacteria group bacterium]
MAKKSKRYWFRDKQYGWGWYPATWEGWLAIAIYVIYLSWRVIQLSQQPGASSSFVFIYVFEIIPPTIVLLAICYLKGEKPRWRWPKTRK